MPGPRDLHDEPCPYSDPPATGVGYEVLHASAGSSGAASCTVFFIRHDDVVSLLAAGSHRTSTTYAIHWSAAPDKFPEGKAVGPTGKL